MDHFCVFDLGIAQKMDLLQDYVKRICYIPKQFAQNTILPHITTPTYFD